MQQICHVKLEERFICSSPILKEELHVNHGKEATNPWNGQWDLELKFVKIGFRARDGN